jgi:hypothetical protein
VSDSGSIVLGWLGKLVIGFAVLGLIAFDGINIVVSNFGAADDASTAANAAADTYKVTHDINAAYQAAVKSVAGNGDTIETKTFVINPDGSVSLYVDRNPTTLWMHRIGPLKSWTHVRESGSGIPGT